MKVKRWRGEKHDVIERGRVRLAYGAAMPQPHSGFRRAVGRRHAWPITDQNGFVLTFKGMRAVQ